MRGGGWVGGGEGGGGGGGGEERGQMGVPRKFRKFACCFVLVKSIVFLCLFLWINNVFLLACLFVSLCLDKQLCLFVFG